MIDLKRSLKENDLKPAWFARQIGKTEETVSGWVKNGMGKARQTSLNIVFKWFNSHNFKIFLNPHNND